MHVYVYVYIFVHVYVYIKSRAEGIKLWDIGVNVAYSFNTQHTKLWLRADICLDGHKTNYTCPLFCWHCKAIVVELTDDISSWHHHSFMSLSQKHGSHPRHLLFWSLFPIIQQVLFFLATKQLSNPPTCLRSNVGWSTTLDQATSSPV